MLKNLKIKNKILLIVILSLILSISIITTFSIISIKQLSNQDIVKYKEKLVENRKMMLNGYISIVKKTIESYYKKSKETDEPIESLKKKALNEIENIRYNGDGYFWINDSNHKMIMHAASPKLNGKNLKETKDAKGKYLFQEIVKAAESNENGGIVNYYWNKPGSNEPQPKMSFAYKFQPWDWIIGTGVYVDDIENDTLKMENESNEKRL